VAVRGATPDEEDEGEELIGDDMEADYRPMGALDEYEQDGLDENEYGDMSASARAAAEAALEARDAKEHQSRMPAALLTSDDDGEERRPTRRRRRDADEHEGDEMDDDGGMAGFFDDEDGGITLAD